MLRFAVYLGGGSYLGRLGVVGELDAARLSRPDAVAALHRVRRAGAGAWIVPHPGVA